MKIALVHDYLNEFGGAERVLLALAEIYPGAPIYTAFCRKNSPAWQRFKGKKIITSWAQVVPFFSRRLYSPLRFLAPKIWGSFNFSQYDLVISSSSWYITKGFNEICYCHTPPRWLYGYQTASNWQKYWPVKVYGQIVGHCLRLYDFRQAQKVKHFIANSEEVKKRIWKFYRREATVIYPPVELPAAAKAMAGEEKQNYYLIVSRPVGGKGIELGIEAAKKYNFPLKVVGGGTVSDEELARLYSRAKAFLALSRDEDFGITPVEAMSCGCPVVAFYGGGYKETIIEGKTGVFFKKYTAKALWQAMEKLNDLNYLSLRQNCLSQAKKFSRERFKKEIKTFVEQHA